MLHIIGIILKMIGIILAVILGILVLLVCIVLFVPVRYEGEVVFPGNVDDIKARAKITWLLHLISAQMVYKKGKMKWQLRIAWKKIGSEQKEHKPEEKPVCKDREKQSENPMEDGQGEVPEKPVEDDQKELTGKLQNAVSEKKNESQEKKISGKLFEKIKAFFEKIKYTFRKICDKIKEITDKKEKITAFLEDDVHRSALSRLKKEMIWIKRFLNPKRFSLNLHFGFDDPYRTGQVLAGLSMLYPFVGEYMNIEPEFEQQVLDGSFHIKGTLRAIYLAILAGKMIFDKNVRATYRNIRNFEL